MPSTTNQVHHLLCATQRNKRNSRYGSLSGTNFCNNKEKKQADTGYRESPHYVVSYLRELEKPSPTSPAPSVPHSMLAARCYQGCCNSFSPTFSTPLTWQLNVNELACHHYQYGVSSIPPFSAPFTCHPHCGRAGVPPLPVSHSFFTHLLSTWCIKTAGGLCSYMSASVNTGELTYLLHND